MKPISISPPCWVVGISSWTFPLAETEVISTLLSWKKQRAEDWFFPAASSVTTDARSRAPWKLAVSISTKIALFFGMIRS